MTRVRRAAAEWLPAERVPQRLGSDADIVELFEGRSLESRWPPFDVGRDRPLAESIEWRPQEPAPDQSPAAVPGFVSPVLMLLATVSTLEGYRRLNVIPAGGWLPPSVVFVGLAIPLAIVLTRPRRDGRRVVAAKMVTLASLVLLAMTVLAIFVNRPLIAHLVGVSDLLFALAALVAVLANERFRRRNI